MPGSETSCGFPTSGYEVQILSVRYKHCMCCVRRPDFAGFFQNVRDRHCNRKQPFPESPGPLQIRHPCPFLHLGPPLAVESGPGHPDLTDPLTPERKTRAEFAGKGARSFPLPGTTPSSQLYWVSPTSHTCFIIVMGTSKQRSTLQKVVSNEFGTTHLLQILK